MKILENFQKFCIFSWFYYYYYYYYYCCYSYYYYCYYYCYCYYLSAGWFEPRPCLFLITAGAWIFISVRRRITVVNRVVVVKLGVSCRNFQKFLDFSDFPEFSLKFSRISEICVVVVCRGALTNIVVLLYYYYDYYCYYYNY